MNISKYKRFVFLVPIVIFTLVLVSCDNKNEAIEKLNQNPEISKELAKEKSAYQIEADVKLKIFEEQRDAKLDEYQKEAKQTKVSEPAATSSDAMTCDQIVEFFPMKVKGAKKRPFIRGNMDSQNETLISSVASDFVYETGTISLSIMDYGAKENIPGVELRSFFGLNDRVGYITGTEDVAFGKIYYSYDTTYGNGIYGCLVNDRAVITCRANAMKDHMKHIKECEELFNIKKIAKNIGKRN